MEDNEVRSEEDGSCLDNCLYARAQRMMGNDRERPCDSCVLLDSAILAYTLLKIEFSGDQFILLNTTRRHFRTSSRYLGKKTAERLPIS